MKKALPDTKTRQKRHEKRKLQINIPHEHGYTNLQNNIRKLNPAIRVINHTKRDLPRK